MRDDGRACRKKNASMDGLRVADELLVSGLRLRFSSVVEAQRMELN